jgi:hypothetical protein
MFYKTKFEGHMRRTVKAFILLFTCFLLVSVFYPESSGAKDANLTFKGEYLSADLKGASLNAIFETLEREKGIWFKGNRSLLEEKVTVQFTDLSLEEGMKRILASMNYSFVFERDGSLVGAILISKGKPGTAWTKSKPDDIKKTIPPQVKKENVIPGRVSDIESVKGDPPIGTSAEGSSRNLKNLEILTNTQSPGAPAEMTPEQLENLKVLRDRAPQGAPAEMTPEQRESMKALKDRPPQGVPTK